MERPPPKDDGGLLVSLMSKSKSKKKTDGAPLLNSGEASSRDVDSHPDEGDNDEGGASDGEQNESEEAHHLAFDAYADATGISPEHRDHAREALKHFVRAVTSKEK